MKNCVYLITNLITHKQYVGVINNLTNRIGQHKRGHDIEHSPIDRRIQEYRKELKTEPIIS